jgi:hypothetical protein
MQNQTSATKPETFWSNSDKAELIKTMAVIVNGQNSYGKTHNLAHLIDYYTMKLEGRFPMSSIIYALNLYTDRKDDVPTPADIINIIDPQKPRITQAEFIHAKEQHKLEGYKNYSYYGRIVKDYEAQEEQGRLPQSHITNGPIKSIIAQSIKKIEG